VLVRTPAMLWGFDFSVIAGKVRVFTLSVDRLAKIVAELTGLLLGVAAAPALIPPPLKSAARFCSQCGTPLRPDARFCTGCGARIG